jgi:hypothetical protein
MKKFLALILAIIYITVSTGFIVNVHYCMGKVSSIKLEQTAKKCCCKKQHKNCCKTEQKLVKLNNNSKLIDAWVAEKSSFSTTDIITYNNPTKVVNAIVASKDLTYNIPPPDKVKRFALLHYCTLLI